MLESNPPLTYAPTGTSQSLEIGEDLGRFAAVAGALYVWATSRSNRHVVSV